MKLRLALLTVLLGMTASAQVPLQQRLVITRVDDATVDRFTFGADSCNETITLRWSNTLLINTGCPSSGLSLWATSASTCGDSPGTSDLVFDSVPLLTVTQLRQGNFDVRIAELPDFANANSSDGGILEPCGSPNLDKTHLVCGALESASQSTFGCGNLIKQRATPLKLVYDTRPPGKPSIEEFTAQDESVRVDFSVDSDTTTVLVETRGPTDIDFVLRGEAANTATFIRAENLKNAVTYDVRIRARDAAGNVSEPSDSVQATPIRTVGFWGYYKDAGGTDTAGCSTGLGLSPLLLLALALRRARRQGE